jgi:hypothetical protein
MEGDQTTLLVPIHNAGMEDRAFLAAAGLAVETLLIQFQQTMGKIMAAAAALLTLVMAEGVEVQP